MMRILAAALLCASGVAAIDLDITSDDVDRALAAGRRGDAAFHKPYTRAVDVTTDAITVQQVEVLTAYRRLVLHAEARRKASGASVSRADVAPILREWHDRAAIVATVRFHPQNVLTSPPAIEVAVRDPILERDVPPLGATRKAIMSAGKDRRLILGAIVETVFDAGLLANLDASVVVSLDGKELARTKIDFRGIE